MFSARIYQTNSLRERSVKETEYLKALNTLIVLVSCVLVITGVILLGGAGAFGYYLIQNLIPNTSSLASSTTNTNINAANVLDSVILSTNEKQILKQMTGNSLTYTLLYRATRDGFKSIDFHSKCDYKYNTITLIQSTKNNVFGGYTSSTWDTSNSYKSDSSAFLFSLRINGASNNVTFPIKQATSQFAIYCNSSYGAVFGSDDALFVQNNAHTTNTNNHELCGVYSCGSYNKFYLNGASSFTPDEIEVFQKS